MATLAEVVKRQRQGGQGALGALTSAIGQKTLETIDPRRMLNQKGLLTALFPSLKPFQAKGAAERVSKASADLSSATTPMLQEMNVKLDIVGTNTKITAKNTMMMPAMARDMNVMRQNIVKLVKLQGGQATNRADAFFMRARERESSYESQFGRSQPATTTTPTPEKKDGGMGMLGMLGGALGLSAVIGGLTKVITSIPSLILSGLSSIPNLIAAGLSSLTSLLAGGLKIGFDLAKGAASVVGSGLKSAGSSILSIIRAAAGFLMSGPGLAVLGVGGVTALLGYLLTNEKTKYGDTEKSGSTMDMEMDGSSDASAPIPSGGHHDTANEEALARVRARQRAESATDPGYIPPNATPSPAMQTAPTPAATSPSPAATSPSTGTEPTKFQNGVSQNLIETVKRLEGFSAKAYPDEKQYSIGYGTKANSPDEVIDESEAERRLIRDLNERQKYVIDYAKRYNYDWNQNQIDSLTSFIYNLGKGALDQVTAGGKRSTQEIIEKMPLYNKAGGEVKEGLVRRRATEVAMFAGTPQMAPPSMATSSPTSGTQIASASSAIADSRFTQSQQPVVVNAPTNNVTQGRGGGQIMGSMADTMDKELASLLVDRMVGA